jgi:NADH-quinone oxidoreductase subunit L
LALFVFIMLALAAFLTAFYTMRQISLTFLGEPRTPLAEHAHESDNFMTIPLMGLSIFAVAAGWFGIPDNFLGVEWGEINLFHHYVGATIYDTMGQLYEMHLVHHPIFTLPFSPVPLITSLVVALGGLGVGWWMYGRRPLQEEEEDPLIGTLGPGIHTFLNRKWYWDELYDAVFVQPTNYFSEVIVYEVMDKGLIDGTLHLIARAFFFVGGYLLLFEQRVISDGVDWVKDQFLAMTKEARLLQTGKVQEYAVVTMVIASALIAVVLAINYGWLAPLAQLF